MDIFGEGVVAVTLLANEEHVFFHSMMDIVDIKPAVLWGIGIQRGALLVLFDDRM